MLSHHHRHHRSRHRHLNNYALLVAALLLFCTTTTTEAYMVPAPLGIGSLLFPVRTTKITGISEPSTTNSGYQKRMELQELSDFFVDAFWTGKVGGGAKTLTKVQYQQLQQSQNAEFTKRYGNSRRISEMLLMRNTANNNKNSRWTTSTSRSMDFNYGHDKGDIMACVGVEVDKIPINGSTIRNPVETISGPLMSNLAVSKQYRRRGLAEQMVNAVEQLIVTQWTGYDECYLYVEEQNRAAIRLYTKLGYRTVWRDGTAKTLLPTVDGDLQSASTTIVCMKKKLVSQRSKNIFQLLFNR